MRFRFLPVVFFLACGGSKPTTTKSAPPPDKVADSGGSNSGSAATPGETPPGPTKPGKPVANTTLAAIGLDPAAMDKTADPCTDFYQYACGNWIKNATIPEDKSSTGRSFEDISDRNLAYEKETLEKLAKEPKTPDEKKLSAYYGSCMDEAAIEKAGLAPFKPLFAIVDSVKDVKSLSLAVAKLHAQGVGGVLFGVAPSQDPANANNVIADLDQGGLGLPDRDYYINDDAQTKQVRAAYEAHVADMLVEGGHKADVAKTEAAQVLALETELAKVSADKVARRDPKAMYNKIDRDGVAKAMPHFDWATYWKTVGLDKNKDVNADVPAFLKGADPLLSSTKPEVWRAYLAYHVIDSVAGYGPKHLEDTAFKFESALTGQPQQPPRWKRCASNVEARLGDLLGALFVRDRFPGDSKKAAEEEVGAISAAMKAGLDALPWMDAATKAKALEKLAKMTYQIGFPKKWRNYTFKVDAKTWAANAMAARQFERTRLLAKIGKPVDRDDWQMTVPQVNAYYDPQLNGMVFPAGILQTPFYNVANAVQVNLGGIGVVVGHEMTHGFDDQGAQFDAIGNLTNWWQPETEKQFKSRTQCVIDQYDAYPSAGGGHVNGKLTNGENIADIGGVKLALAAYRALRAGAPDAMVADGYTEDQQFFLGYGQAWCEKMRPQFEQMLVNVDPHSPSRWRVNGALSATPDFAKAFSCKSGAKMAPAKQCVVW